MGSSFSMKSESPPIEATTTKPNNVRCSIRAKQPMPDANELERRFTKVLVSKVQNLFPANYLSYSLVGKGFTSSS